MDKTEHIARLDEMRRLYEKDKKTLRGIADLFGISRQTVHNRLKEAGVQMRPKGASRKSLDRKILHRLYIDEQMPIAEIARRLKTDVWKVSAELDRYGIEKRPPCFHLRKYPELYMLVVGETLELARPPVTDIYRHLYEKAKKAGIRISIRSKDVQTVLITRVK